MTPPRWLVQLAAVFVKEVRQTLRDKRIVVLLTIAPFIQLLALGYAVDLEVDRVPTVVVDLDDTPESRRLTAAMLADGTLTRVDQRSSVPEADEALVDGTAAVAIIVPSGLERDLARGEPAQVQVLLDGTDPTRSGVAGGAASRFLGEEGMRLAQQQLAARGGPAAIPSVEVRPRLLYNPTMASPIYMVPGIAGMLLMMITMVITSMGLAREAEVGTLEQVRVTPLPSWVLMVGKVTPFILVGLLDVTAAIAAGAWVFDLPIRGSLLTFYLLTGLYLLTTVGLGLLISTVSSSQQQAFIGAFMLMMPAMLLSGTLTPIHAMPEWLQPITWVNPLRWYLEAVRAILLKGTSLFDLWLQVSALLAFGVITLGAATRRFSATR